MFNFHSSTGNATSKKCEERGPCGSLIDAILQAVSSSSNLSPVTINVRNSALEAQLAAKSLKSINVCGDGNCFFRALSMSLYGDESAHAQLRTSIAQHLADLATSFSRLLASRLRTQPRSLKLPMRYDNHACGQAKTLRLWLLIFFSETFKFI